MAIEIGAYEAKSRLPEILRRVEGGESFTITNRGKPVADLVPSRSSKDEQVRDVINQIKSFRKFRMTDDEYRQHREEGRK